MKGRLVEARMRAVLLVAAATVAAGIAGCSDQGDSGTDPPPNVGPVISALVPARTVPADTVVIEGSGFGASSDGSAVLFPAGSGSQAAEVLAGGWSETRIRAVVPTGVVTGGVKVRVGSSESPARPFEVASQAVAFESGVLPIFQARCASCHGQSAPQAGLTVLSREGLLAGGVHGPAVIPRRSGQSLLVQKLRPSPPFGNRMPDGMPPLTDAEILAVADWIDQGARGAAPDPGPAPVLEALVPLRTVIGDSLVLEGRDFGEEQEGGRVVFSGGAEASVFDWTDARIVVAVPSGAGTGPVRVVRKAQESDGIGFEVAPREISYQTDLLPRFQQNGCVSCHSGPFGSGGLSVTPYADLLSGGSDHGPVIVRRRSGESVIVQKLSPTPPFLDRMPLGGALSEAEQLLVADWIDQGAKNN